MTDDMASRDALRELLLDGVAPPAASDAMFARTFAADGAGGADLLPPDGLFDEPTDPDLDDPDLDDGATLDDPAVDDGVPLADDAGGPDLDPSALGVDHDWSDPGAAEHPDTGPADPGADPALDPGHGDPSVGW